MVVKRIATVFLALVLLAPLALAHGGQESQTGFSLSGLQLAWYSGIVLCILAVIAVMFRNRMGKTSKKGFSSLFAIIIIGTTAMMDGPILYANIVSPFHGPVHWHAELSFDICGQHSMLSTEEMATDKPLHTHGDSMIHIETTPLSLEDVEIHHFFEDIGGIFTDDELLTPTDHGMVHVKNGDLCNGKPGKLSMVVNGNPEPKMDAYVISPIEAGNIDKIVIVFGSE